jgi:hypothetical protein
MIGWLACAREPSIVAGADPTRIEIVADAPIELRRVGSERPVAGRAWRDGRFRFVPAAPLRAGASYEVRSGRHTLTWTVPPAPRRPSDDVSIWPAAEVVPENHLRFLVGFPAPMRSGPELFDAITLIRESTGQPVPVAFAQAPLWSADRTELTLLLHPGRQKRDIPFAEEAGPVLREGERYTLRISGALADIHGVPLGAGAEKHFLVGPPDHERPDPALWTVLLPVDDDDPIRIVVDEPVDAALARRAFAVTSPRGEVPLHITLGSDDRSLLLSPGARWPEGALVLGRLGRLEDLAGNTPERRFERRPGEPDAEIEPFSVRFEVSGPGPVRTRSGRR